MLKYKQIIAIRTDLKLSKTQLNKIIAWASLNSARKTQKNYPSLFNNWMTFGQGKIVIKIKSQEELNKILLRVQKKNKISFFPIYHNENLDLDLPRGEFIALGIGPANESILSSFTSEFKLL